MNNFINENRDIKNINIKVKNGQFKVFYIEQELDRYKKY